MTEWRIEEKSGSYTLFRERKFIDSFDSREIATECARKLLAPKDTLVVLEEDGYKTRISPRKHWRK